MNASYTLSINHCQIMFFFFFLTNFLSVLGQWQEVNNSFNSLRGGACPAHTTVTLQVASPALDETKSVHAHKNFPSSLWDESAPTLDLGFVFLWNQAGHFITNTRPSSVTRLQVTQTKTNCICRTLTDTSVCKSELYSFMAFFSHFLTATSAVLRTEVIDACFYLSSSSVSQL